jgi:hypothetical protein
MFARVWNQTVKPNSLYCAALLLLSLGGCTGALDDEWAGPWFPGSAQQARVPAGH